LAAFFSAFCAVAVAAAAREVFFDAAARASFASAFAAFRDAFVAFVAALSTPPCPEQAPRPAAADVVPSLQTAVPFVLPCALRGAAAHRTASPNTIDPVRQRILHPGESRKTDPPSLILVITGGDDGTIGIRPPAAFQTRIGALLV